jgi:REP element-mobilizing transposase RayT
MHVHLVFVTKYRRCLLDGQAIERLKRYIEQQATPL